MNCLSDEINKNILQSEKDGGVFLESLPIGAILEVQTQNTLYKIEKVFVDQYLLSGNLRYCPVPTRAIIHGSSWGGSMLKMGFVGIGMYLEFKTPEFRETTRVIISSQIQSVKLLNSQDVIQ